MTNRTSEAGGNRWGDAHSVRPGCRSLSAARSNGSMLHLVTETEWRALAQALAGGGLPADFKGKLARLETGGLVHQQLEQACRLFLALLDASGERGFIELPLSQRDRLLRVLAYVRKEEDAIPDVRPDGFMDDLFEVRAASADLQPLIDRFKQWRLRHLVPRLWR